MDPLIIVFLLFFIGCLVWHFDRAKKEKKVSVLYGYPAGRTTWLTIYHRRSTDEWIFEWDDLFDEGRPKSWGDINQCQMYADDEEGASSNEIAKAREMVRERFG